MLDIRYCQHCTCDLAGYGAPAHDMYEYICHVYIYTGQCLAIDSSLIKFLESKSFITSADLGYDPYVFVKPIGIHIWNEAQGLFICAKASTHAI